MPVTLIADDLTGACDAGALFAGRGRVGVFVDVPATGDWDVAAIDTETRELPPAAAAAHTRAAVARMRSRLRGGRLFWKVDSTLRGPVGAELDAVLEATGARRAVVCPAFPAQGRTVVGRELQVDGVPCHASPIGRDPAFASRTSDVAAILAKHSTRRLVHLALDVLRGSAQGLREAIDRVDDGCIVADAATETDLDALAAAALESADTVLAGSAGLARAVAARLGHLGADVPLPDGRAWLIVVGSLHPASRAQVRAIRDAGVAGLAIDQRAPDVGRVLSRLRDGQPAFLTTRDGVESGAVARHAVAASLAAVAARIIAESRPDLVVITGGETARALLAALGTDHLALRGTPGSGLALADIVTGAGSALTWLTKAGGFGPPDLWISLLKGCA